ncbi:ribonuclease HII [Formosa maritima]|uniref:Ribonuclease HII n=1 Tax=Formosa maritima TaxID=2592046 RepID=A0A5D0G3V9_9FLAO|nr:ribonuclease HII [Formosa maritima]TYA53320.1 ribonuclease HII [Formosa maritima]
MKRFFYSIFILLLITGCNVDNKISSPSDFIPENPSLVLKISNIESLNSNIRNNDLLNDLSISNIYKSITNKLEVFKHLNTNNDILLSFVEDEKDSLQYAFITKYQLNILNIDSLPNHSEETIKTKQHTFTKTTINNKSVFSIIKDSLLIGASTQDLLINSINKDNKNIEIENLLDTSDPNSQLSIIFNEKNGQLLGSIFNQASTANVKFTEYLLVDVDLEQDEILLNGITKATDSIKSLINIFKNTIPQENLLAKITPANSDGFLSFTFNNYSNFRKNLDTYKLSDSLDTETTLFDNIVEVGVIFEENNQAIVLNSLDETSTDDALSNEQSLIETYRQINIFDFSQPDLFSNAFSPLISFKNANMYCVIDNFFVFGNSVEALQNIIANYQNNTTLNDRSYFETIKENLSDEASLMLVVNPNKLNSIIQNIIDEEFNLDLEKYKCSAIQFIFDNHYAHVNAVIKKSKTKAVENSVTEEFNIKLNEDLLNIPQLVINHESNQKEIVVQDVKNNLYLISNTGKLLWKKQLEGAVLGKIEQIDMYKNGRLQLAFATSNRVYVLDRNGKDVSPFPLKFNDQITQPLSIFDYDNNRNYRLLITQGKSIFMVDQLGKTVKGFTFKNAESALNHQPQHIRIGRNDYLLFKTNNKLYILDRIGKTRVAVNKNYNYSNQAVYLYNNKFTTTTKYGKLVTIDTKGNTSEQNLNLTDLHNIETTSKTLAAQSENKLIIKTKTIELDYGNYTDPEIFYIYDKIYVSVTDLQSKKIYLFDSQGQSISNFPVYGNSKITLDNIDKDRNLEFVTKADNNSFIIYQIN